MTAFKDAQQLLLLLEPETSNDPETLGLWGAIHKGLWATTKELGFLDVAVRAYERGFYLRNDYYNGINFAYLLNERAAVSTDQGEAIADFVQARRVRREVIAICEQWLRVNAPTTVSPYACEARSKIPRSGLLGSGHDRRSAHRIRRRSGWSAETRGSFCRGPRNLDEGIHAGAGEQTKDSAGGFSAEKASRADPMTVSLGTPPNDKKNEAGDTAKRRFAATRSLHLVFAQG